MFDRENHHRLKVV